MRPVCGRCGRSVVESEVEGYSYTCPHCDEDFYSFEVLFADDDTPLSFVSCVYDGEMFTYTEYGVDDMYLAIENALLEWGIEDTRVIRQLTYIKY